MKGPNGGRRARGDWAHKPSRRSGARDGAGSSPGQLLAQFRQLRLGPAFFARDALVVAEELVGCVLVVAAGEVGERGDGEIPFRAARIVETEAYRGPDDRACHARFGVTERTRTLFGRPGDAYVFRVYGMHDCLNAVCLREGSGHAVLLRAGEPVFGLPAGTKADGPGKLSSALGVGRDLNGQSFLGTDVFFARGARLSVTATPRVGVAYAGDHADFPWRFYEDGNVHVSRPPLQRVGQGCVKGCVKGRVTKPKASANRGSRSAGEG